MMAEATPGTFSVEKCQGRYTIRSDMDGIVVAEISFPPEDQEAEEAAGVDAERLAAAPLMVEVLQALVACADARPDCGSHVKQMARGARALLAGIESRARRWKRHG
jgi:hypothetical protein